MRIIELFSGTQNMSKTFRENGHKTFTIDNNPDLNPDLCINMLDFNIELLPKEFQKPDVIWASPPCTTFSVASLYRYWNNGKPSSYKTFIGMALIHKTIEIIKQLNPKYWFIENPRGMLRKQYFMDNLPRMTVTYCQYGAEYQKPTDIWNNTSWIPRKRCSAGDLCHESSTRGSKNSGIQKLHGNRVRSELPIDLCKEILKVCENKTNIKQLTLNNGN